VEPVAEPPMIVPVKALDQYVEVPLETKIWPGVPELSTESNNLPDIVRFVVEALIKRLDVATIRSAFMPDWNTAGPANTLVPVNRESANVSKLAVPERIVGLVRELEVKDELVLKNGA
jgi:hypothetical protein